MGKHEHTHDETQHTHGDDHGQHSHPHSHAHSNNHGHSHPHSHAHSNSHGHSHTHTHTKSVLNRLARANGHLARVRKMVEEGHDCSEVLIQLAAVRGAINKVSEIILKDHLSNCIVEAVETGDNDALDELSRAIELLLK